MPTGNSTATPVGGEAATAWALACRAHCRADEYRWLVIELGRWAECDELLREALAARRSGIPGAKVRYMAARLAARRGQASIAQQHLDRAIELVPIEFIGLFGQMFQLELLVGRGEPETALELLGPALTEALALGRERRTDSLLLWGARAAADVAARARDLRDSEAEIKAIHALDELLAAAETTPLARPDMSPDEDPLWSAYRVLVIAETCRCRGSAGQPEAWERVASRYRAIGFRWFEAMAQWRQAQALLSEGAARGTVAVPLRRAHATALELGAAPLVEETVLLAMVARIRLDEPAGSQSKQVQPEVPQALATLTSREREVLSHLVVGRDERRDRPRSVHQRQDSQRPRHERAAQDRHRQQG